MTAVSCNAEQCAAAFSLPRSRPEVVVWSRDGESTSYVAPESRTVTALALPPDACETTVVGGGDDGLFAVIDGRARRLSIKCGDVGCCACDESGTAVAAGCGKVLEVANTLDGRRIASFEGHRARITGCAFRAGGGPFVATCSEDRSFRVWDLGQKSCAVESSVLCAPALTCLAFADDGRVAVAAADGRAWVWRTRDGCREDVAVDLSRASKLAVEPRKRRSFLPAEAKESDDEVVYPLALCLDGASLHVAAAAATFIVDLVSREVSATRGLDAAAAASLSASEEGVRCCRALAFEATVMNGDLGETAAEVENGPLSFFSTSAIPDASPLRKDLALKKAEKKVLAAFDNRKKAPKKKGTMLHKVDMPITFHSRIKSSGYGPGKGKKQARAPSMPRREPAVLTGPPDVHQPQHDGPVDTDTRSVVHAAFAPDAKSIAVATVGGPPVVVRTPVAKYQNTDFARCALGVDDATHVDVSRCGGYIIASGGTVSPQIFPSPSPTTRHVDAPACRLQSGASGFRFYYLDRFVVGPDGGDVVLDAVALDANPDRCRSKRVHRFTSGVKRIECVACLNDRYSPLIIAAASDKTLRILDAASGRCAREIVEAHLRPPHALAAPRSSDHDVFASAAVDGVVALWDVRSQSAVARFTAHACRRDPVDVAFSPCMRYLATGSEDAAAYVYDVRRAGAEDAVWKCRGARETVACVAFSPLHPQLATVGFDGCLRFYTCGGGD